MIQYIVIGDNVKMTILNSQSEFSTHKGAGLAAFQIWQIFLFFSAAQTGPSSH